MKNKFRYLLKYLFICVMLIPQIALSSELKFESNTIDTKDNDIVIASGEVKITDNLGQKITADKLELNKIKKIHNLNGNVYFEDDVGNKIFSENLIIDEIKKIYIFKNNVVIEDELNSITIKTNEILYNQIDKTIISVGLTKLNKNSKYFIESTDVVFNRAENTLIFENKSLLKDNLNNFIEIEKFQFYLKKNQLFAYNTKITDKEKNIYEIEQMKYDFNESKIYGKDIIINKDNKISENKHLPRSNSRALILENDSLNLKKSVYTNCKKRDGCPPWLIQAEEVNHDKKNKIINYKNATLKFYDIPVFYFPKFFHPGPTVKRQSGFLTPRFSAKNSSGYLLLPYFFAISNDSDFTFSPRIYDNSKNLYQGEYRKVKKKSEHTFDFSIKNDDPLLLDDKSTDTHFFLNSSFKPNFELFKYSEFDIKLQTVSDEKYLKSFDISSPIIDSQNTLTSQILFEGFNDDLELSISTEIYEDLTKENKNDRYEYILPNFNITKNLNTELSGLLELNSIGYNKIYETNINEKIFVNNLTYKSLDKINKLGFINNYELKIKNFNSDSKNSTSLKNRTENTFQGLLQFNSKIPFAKDSKNFRKTLTPIVSAKFNPYNNKSITGDDRLIDYTNIYSVNRLSSNEILEGGNSITLGNEYKIFNKSNLSDEIFGIGLAASFRDNENNDLPVKSSLGQKTSNIVGQTRLKLNDLIDTNYNFILDNNLEKINYHKIKTNFKVNNFVTSFEFLEENNNIGKESFLSNETEYKFSDNKNLIFRTRKNKKTDLTEYYNLIYQYKMDCLTAGIEYKKDYYNDGSIKPEESVFFSITFLPFSNTIDFPGIDK